LKKVLEWSHRGGFGLGKRQPLQGQKTGGLDPIEKVPSKVNPRGKKKKKPGLKG